ncbi:MAG TPA: hypothetical protein VMR95_02240 [Candidatus Binatia bacterium]|jgi:hypothetical protein|nr:hypothetical protein [Candidatus Binatia bacterium]
MNEAFKILVIIVSSVLSLFLIVCIVAVITITRLLKDVRLLVQKAEKLVESTEAVGEALRHVKGPLFLFKLIQGIVGATKKENKEG